MSHLHFYLLVLEEEKNVHLEDDLKSAEAYICFRLFLVPPNLVFWPRKISVKQKKLDALPLLKF